MPYREQLSPSQLATLDRRDGA